MLAIIRACDQLGGLAVVDQFVQLRSSVLAEFVLAIMAGSTPTRRFVGQKRQCMYYWCASCPFSADCSQPSWKRAKVNGKTPEIARSALVHHLMMSKLHGLTKESAKDVAADTDLERDWMTDDEPDSLRGTAKKDPRQVSAVEDARGGIAEAIVIVEDATRAARAAADALEAAHIALANAAESMEQSPHRCK